MKKIFAMIVGAAICIMSLSSCSKTLADTVCGTYHFKMSGNMLCNGQDIYDDASASISQTFVLSSQTGQMHIVKEGDDLYLVTMSVMLGGDVMAFEATVSGDSINLKENEIIINIKEEGDASSKFLSNTSVSLNLSGTGKKYDDMIMFEMKCNGSFWYDGIYFTVSDKQDIICVADRNQ